MTYYHQCRICFQTVFEAQGSQLRVAASGVRGFGGLSDLENPAHSRLHLICYAISYEGSLALVYGFCRYTVYFTLRLDPQIEHLHVRPSIVQAHSCWCRGPAMLSRVSSPVVHLEIVCSAVSQHVVLAIPNLWQIHPLVNQ